MNIGIISDTHDNAEATERAIEIFREEGVEIVIHCGDFIAPLIVPYFEEFELHGVLGNNDGDVANLQAAFDSLGGESQLHGQFADLEFDGLSVAVLHGESKAEVEAIAAGETYDFVCYGHHHERASSPMTDGQRCSTPAHTSWRNPRRIGPWRSSTRARRRFDSGRCSSSAESGTLVSQTLRAWVARPTQYSPSCSDKLIPCEGERSEPLISSVCVSVTKAV